MTRILDCLCKLNFNYVAKDLLDFLIKEIKPSRSTRIHWENAANNLK